MATEAQRHRERRAKRKAKNLTQSSQRKTKARDCHRRTEIGRKNEERSLPAAGRLRSAHDDGAFEAARDVALRFLATNYNLAHAGYYYGYVVGLFGCAGPLFCGGY